MILSYSSLTANCILLSIVFNILQPQDRHHDPTGRRFEIKMSRLARNREALAEAERETKAEAVKGEIPLEPDEEEDMSLRPTASTSNNQSDPWSRFRRAAVEDEDEDAHAFSRPRNGEPVELSGAMLTPPPTPRSTYVEIEPITNAQDPRATIQTLRSRLEREERMVANLEQELGLAKRQLEQYTAERNLVQDQQEQAFMKNDRNKTARLKEQVEGIRTLLGDSRADVSRLEDELVSKDRLICELRTEISNRSEGLQGRSIPSRPPGEGRRIEPRARRDSSGMLLKRDEAGVRIIRNANVYDMPKGTNFMWK